MSQRRLPAPAEPRVSASAFRQQQMSAVLAAVTRQPGRSAYYLAEEVPGEPPDPRAADGLDGAVFGQPRSRHATCATVVALLKTLERHGKVRCDRPRHDDRAPWTWWPAGPG